MAHDAHHAEGHAHAHWDTSIYPFIISFGILFLAVAFSFKFVYHNGFAAILALGLGIPMIIAGIAGWTSEAMGKGEGLSYGAMGWFILAEAMIFVSFFVSYWYTKLHVDVWPPAGNIELPRIMPLVMTFILVASSLTIHYAEHLLHLGNKAGFRTWYLLTIVLGACFLGMSVYEWSHLIHEWIHHQHQCLQHRLLLRHRPSRVTRGGWPGDFPGRSAVRDARRYRRGLHAYRRPVLALCGHHLVLRRFAGLLLVAAAALLVPVARAVTAPTQNSIPDGSVMQIDEPRFLGNRMIGDTVLTDEEGRDFRVADLLGKPVILLLSYYGCDGSCPTMNAELAKVLAKVTRFALGKDYRVLDGVLRQAGFAGDGEGVSWPRRAPWPAAKG
jgi:cytochrome c oxidase subunit 3